MYLFVKVIKNDWKEFIRLPDNTTPGQVVKWVERYQRNYKKVFGGNDVPGVTWTTMEGNDIAKALVFSSKF